jgi:hypothetical protein
MDTEWNSNLDDPLEVMTVQIALLVQHAEKHRAKIKAKAYKSDRALLMAATSIYHGIVCIRNSWAMMKADLESQPQTVQPGRNGTR